MTALRRWSFGLATLLLGMAALCTLLAAIRLFPMVGQVLAATVFLSVAVLCLVMLAVLL